MSLGIVIKAPEGLVLAAESRVTLTATPPAGPPVNVGYDNATKLLSFSSPHDGIGVVTYGAAAIGLRTAHSFIPELEAALQKEKLSVTDFARALSDFYMQQWNAVMPADYAGPSMTFVVSGYDDGEPYGTVCVLDIPANPQPREQHPGAEFGITWGGQRDVVDRLIQGFDARLPDVVAESLSLEQAQTDALRQALQQFQMAIPLPAMPLQDCVDLAIFFIRTTIDAQALTVGIRGCGGPIDVAIIRRREGMTFVQQKRISGEFGAGTWMQG